MLRCGMLLYWLIASLERRKGTSVLRHTMITKLRRRVITCTLDGVLDAESMDVSRLTH